ncbi:MAG: hypothetical protein J5838_07195 [Desulfovibrio sp.]|nr:hypothetical protein [Desulfovibrio sp.]
MDMPKTKAERTAQGNLFALLPAGARPVRAMVMDRANEAPHCCAPHEVDATILLRAIREKCLECSGGHLHEVSACEIIDCPLYPFKLLHAEHR